MILKIARRDVVTARPEDSVRDVAGLMEYYRVGCVVIARGERPVGIVTDRDLAIRLLAGKGNGLDAGTLAVQSVMTARPQTVREAEGLDKAVGLMRMARCRRLPVVDARGKLRGLLSMDDVVEAVGRSMIGVVSALRRQQKPPRRRPVPAAKAAAAS